jgi:hypothetical protein
MSNYKENHKDTPDFDIIPEGSYQAKVLSSVIKPSKSSGKDTWYLEFELESFKYRGRRLMAFFGMADNSAGFRKGALTAMGLDTATTIDLIDDVINRHCVLEVKIEEKEGQKKNKIGRLRTIKVEEPGELEKEFTGGNPPATDDEQLPF